MSDARVRRKSEIQIASMLELRKKSKPIEDYLAEEPDPADKECSDNDMGCFGLKSTAKTAEVAQYRQMRRG